MNSNEHPDWGRLGVVRAAGADLHGDMAFLFEKSEQ